MFEKNLLEKISVVAADFRGEIVFALDATGTSPQQNLQFDASDDPFPTLAALENVAPQKSIFENLAAPLVAAGTPWETAQEKIFSEMQFWFGENSPEIANARASAAVKSVAIARALLAALQGSRVLLVPAFLLDTESLARLQERAAKELFTVIVLSENFAQVKAFGAKRLLVFYKKQAQSSPNENDEIFSVQTGTPDEVFANPATLAVAQKLHNFSGNVFTGTLCGFGAGEFFAETSAGQIHGKLCDNFQQNSDDSCANDGNVIKIFLPLEIFHIDIIPPEENFFTLETGGEISFDGHLFRREFSIKSTNETDTPVRLVVASQFRQTLDVPANEPDVFAWFFPEDALGFL